MLQGGFDESEKGNAFALAGYVATPEKWMAFSDQWSQAILSYNNGYPFKMKNAMSQWGEEKRREQLGALYGIICDHVSFGVSAGVDSRLLKQILAPLPHKKWRDPHYFCLHGLVSHLLMRNDFLKGDRIQFTFDKGRSEKAVRKTWAAFMASAPPQAQASIVGEANFLGDEEWMPLQAADFRAWWARHHLERNLHGAPRLPEPWRAENRGKFPTILLDFNEQYLIWFRDLALGNPMLLVRNDGSLEMRVGNATLALNSG
jgi:hypothetical protein